MFHFKDDLCNPFIYYDFCNIFIYMKFCNFFIDDSPSYNDSVNSYIELYLAILSELSASIYRAFQVDSRKFSAEKVSDIVKKVEELEESEDILDEEYRIRTLRNDNIRITNRTDLLITREHLHNCLKFEYNLGDEERYNELTVLNRLNLVIMRTISRPNDVRKITLK